jgi:hypothetical protein
MLFIHRREKGSLQSYHNGRNVDACAHRHLHVHTGTHTDTYMCAQAPTQTHALPSPSPANVDALMQKPHIFLCMHKL